MKLLFKNTTQYNKSVYDKFLTFHRNKYRFSYMAYTILIIFSVLLCLTLQIKYHNYSIAILFCFGLTAFILWRFLHPISEVAKEYKSDKIQKEKTFTFKFYEKYFTVQDTKEIFKLKYHKLYKIFETCDFFYLYIDKTHAFLLDKSKFKKNNSADFSVFIKKKCWWKIEQKGHG